VFEPLEQFKPFKQLEGGGNPAHGGTGTSPRKMMSKKWQADNGFTLIETIMVVVIIGILASAFVYRYNRSTDTDGTMAANQLIADIQYVQIRAMGIGRPQNILFTAGTGSYSIREGTNIVEQKNLPDPANVIIRNTNLPGNTLTFNTIGEPTFSASDNGTIVLGKGTNTYKTITVFPITGKVQ
jgi:prepilin-type N-terminal cleavage/methylation domain-containing protein